MVDALAQRTRRRSLKNMTSAMTARTKMIGWMITPPAMAMMNRMIARASSNGIPLFRWLHLSQVYPGGFAGKHVPPRHRGRGDAPYTEPLCLES